MYHKLKSRITDYSKRSPRLLGIFILLLGIGLAIFLRHSYQTGDSIDIKVVFITPFCLLYGLMITVQPALFIPEGGFLQAPILHKVMYILVCVVGIGLGIYLDTVVFAAWK